MWLHSKFNQFLFFYFWRVTHIYCTRSRNTLSIPSYRLTSSQHKICYTGSKLWNSLPSHIQCRYSFVSSRKPLNTTKLITMSNLQVDILFSLFSLSCLILFSSWFYDIVFSTYLLKGGLKFIWAPFEFLLSVISILHYWNILYITGFDLDQLQTYKTQLLIS